VTITEVHFTSYEPPTIVKKSFLSFRRKQIKLNDIIYAQQHWFWKLPIIHIFTKLAIWLVVRWIEKDRKLLQSSVLYKEHIKFEHSLIHFEPPLLGSHKDV
jgi:hypothetical protein